MGKKRAVYEGCTNLKEIGQRDLENLTSALSIWKMIKIYDCRGAVILIIGGVFLFGILMSGVDPSALVMK